jgi:hypothetical protein
VGAHGRALQEAPRLTIPEIVDALNEARGLKSEEAARRCLHLMLQDQCGMPESTLEDQVALLRDLHGVHQGPSDVTDEHFQEIDKAVASGACLAAIERLFAAWYGQKKAL